MVCTYMYVIYMSLIWEKNSNPMAVFARKHGKLFFNSIFFLVQRQKINQLPGIIMLTFRTEVVKSFASN